MKPMKKSLFFVWFALAVSPVWAGPKGIVKSFDFNNGSGVIDYDGGYVEATAIGTVDMSKMVNSVQAEMVARKTARHLAYEVLAETVGRIQIDSKTLYKNAVAEIDAMKADTHAVIRGAVIQSDTLEWVPDRITKAETPMGKVTLRLYLTGEEGLGHLIDKYLPVEGGYVESERPVQKAESLPPPEPVSEPQAQAPTTPETTEKAQVAPPEAAEEEKISPPASSPDKVQEEPTRQIKPSTPVQAEEDETALAKAGNEEEKETAPPTDEEAVKEKETTLAKATTEAVEEPSSAEKAPEIEPKEAVAATPVATAAVATTAVAEEPGPEKEQPEKEQPQKQQVEKKQTKVSALIVDTREVPPGYEPAIRLKIKDEAGNLVYGPGVARASIAREGGRFFRYSENMDEAKQLFADDGEPMVVKAAGTPAPGEITIPSSDAETVSEANQRDVFLREARVVVVLK